MILIYSGIASGVLMGLGMGNVKILIVKNTIEKSIKKGFIVLSGVVLSDIFLISLVQLADLFIKIPANLNKYIFLVFGILFLGFSVFQFYSFFRVQKTIDVSKSNFLPKSSAFVSGFLYNTLNPYNYLTWLGFNVFANKYSHQMFEKILFFGLIIIFMVIVDGIIILNVRKINLILKHKKYLTLINAFIFLGLGIKMLF